MFFVFRILRHHGTLAISHSFIKMSAIVIPNVSYVYE